MCSTELRPRGHKLGVYQLLVVLDFNYSQRDCVRAWRRHFREKLNLALDLVAIVVLAAFGLFQWRASGFGLAALVSLAMSAALALIVVIALFAIPQLAYRKSDKLKQPYHLEFSEDAIEFRTRDIESRLQWHLYGRVLIDRHSYLLYHGKDEFTIVPKWVFANRDARQAFERLLERKVKTVVRR